MVGSRSLVHVALILAATLGTLHAQRKFDEREVKATFLFNFAQFVDWPATSFANPAVPFVICVLGVDPFERVLDAVVEGEVVKNRPLSVARFKRIEDVSSCHILFVSASEAPHFAQLIPALHGRAILTVGDADGFTESGGMIRFVVERNRIRLRINLAAAQAAGVTISSQLLRVAEIVGPGKIR
jgi:hypothetical protein